MSEHKSSPFNEIMPFSERMAKTTLMLMGAAISVVCIAGGFVATYHFMTWAGAQ